MRTTSTRVAKVGAALLVALAAALPGGCSSGRAVHRKPELTRVERGLRAWGFLCIVEVSARVVSEVGKRAAGWR